MRVRMTVFEWKEQRGLAHVCVCAAVSSLGLLFIESEWEKEPVCQVKLPISRQHLETFSYYNRFPDHFSWKKWLLWSVSFMALYSSEVPPSPNPLSPGSTPKTPGLPHCRAGNSSVKGSTVRTSCLKMRTSSSRPWDLAPTDCFVKPTKEQRSRIEVLIPGSKGVSMEFSRFGPHLPCT